LPAIRGEGEGIKFRGSKGGGWGRKVVLLLQRKKEGHVRVGECRRHWPFK